MLLRFVALLIALAFPVSLQTAAQGTKPAPRTGQASSAKDVSSQADLPDARALINKSVTAIGGRAAVLSHKSEHQTGTIVYAQSGMSGTMEVFGASDPDRTFVKVTMPGIGDISSGFDGEHGWDINPMTGPRLLVGTELDQAKLDADFYEELRDPKIYPTIHTIARTDFDSHPCYKVSVTSTTGITDIDYYDVSTGLRVGSEQTRDTPMGKITATSTIGDYKKFGNLLQPTALTQRAEGVEEKMTIQSVEFDNVDPSVFELPAPIKALIK